jgi:hypothetical protein
MEVPSRSARKKSKRQMSNLSENSTSWVGVMRSEIMEEEKQNKVRKGESHGIICILKIVNKNMVEIVPSGIRTSVKAVPFLFY